MAEVLKQCWNDANSAVELIFAEMKLKGSVAASVAAEPPGNQASAIDAREVGIPAETSNLTLEREGNMATKNKDERRGAKEKKQFIRGNDSCPCGSSKKYKRCCKVSGTTKRLQAEAALKAAKESERNKVAAGSAFSGVQGDFGALAI